MRQAKSSSPTVQTPAPAHAMMDPKQLHLHDGHRVFGEPQDHVIAALASDIADRGLQHPIELTPAGKIIAGRKRWMACLKLGMSKVPCRIRHDLAAAGEDAMMEHLLADNLVRSQLRPLERARAYAALKELTRTRAGKQLNGDVRDEVAKSLGKSGRSLDRLARVLQAPREVQDALDLRKLTLKEANAVVNLPSAQQQELAGMNAAGDAPRKALRKFVGKIISTPTRSTPLAPQSPAALLPALTAAISDVVQAISLNSLMLSGSQLADLDRAIRQLSLVVESSRAVEELGQGNLGDLLDDAD
jgi:ParB/RepB/Spo0J family partition protein